MKFKFRLEKVLSHKKIERDLAHRDFAEAQKRYDDGVKKLNFMHQEITDAKKYESSLVSQGGQAAEALKWSDFFIRGQNVRIEMQKKTNRDLIQDVERKQEVLIEKAKEFKTFEKLREKMFERFKKLQKKHDAKITDEIVIMNSTRKELR